MPLKKNDTKAPAPAKDAAKAPEAKQGTEENQNAAAAVKKDDAPAKLMVGDNLDLDPDSAEGQAWVTEQARRQKALDDQKVLDELALDQKRQDDERTDREAKANKAKDERREQLQREADLQKDLDVANEKELKDAPKPGRYAAVKSRLRDPISGKSFLVSKSTIVKKGDMTKWFIKQYEAGLLAEFDEAEEEE